MGPNCLEIEKEWIGHFKSFYNNLVRRYVERVIWFLANQIWKVKTSQRIAFFLFGKRKYILTIDRLMRRGKTMVNGRYLCKCYPCKKSCKVL